MRRRVLISTDQLDNYHEIGVTAAITYQPKQNRDALNSGHKLASSLLSTTAQAQRPWLDQRLDRTRKLS